MTPFPRRLRALAAAAVALLSTSIVRGDGSASALPFSQNWTSTSLITANDNWSGVPGIEGFLGQDLTTATGTDPQTLLGTSAVANDLDVIANQSSPSITNGGVAEFEIANPTIALQGSGTADAPHIVIGLNTTGFTAVNVAYNVRDIDATADNAVQQVALQYRVGNSGSFTNLPAGYIADATTGPSLATLVTPVSVTLPGAADNQALVQVRILTTNAVGNDEWVGIDDISVTGTTGGTTPSLSVNGPGSVTEGNAGTTTAHFTVDLSLPAPVGGVTFDIATLDGTATVAGGDYVARSLTGQVIPEGASTYTFDVTVNGDAVFEPNETFKVKVTNVANANVSTSEATATITNDDAVAIHDVQGTGATSPVVGQVVTLEGIVTGVKSNGFFIQASDVDADANPLTPEGIQIFTSSAPPATAAIGNLVRVTGTVSEFIPSADPDSPPLTEVTGPTVSVLSTGNPLPAPVTIASMDPAGSLEQIEHLEGMRVHVDSLTAIAPTQGVVSEANATSASNGVFYGVITGQARPFREAGIRTPDPVPSPNPPNVPRFDNNPERLRVDSDAQAGSVALDVATGAVITNMTGVLDYGFRTYTILPDAATPPTVASPGLTAAVPVPAKSANQATVGAFNMERFFDTVDDPGISDIALTSAAFERRLAKASLAIRNVMRTPDILGVVEMENLATLQAVAARVSSDAVAASQSDPGYTGYLVEGNDIGGIDVGFLVKSGVSVTDVTQVGKDETFVDPTDSSVDILFDRPPLVLRATVPTASGDVPFTVIVNHLRSLNDIDGTSATAIRVRVKRSKGAQWLADYVQSRQVADPTEHIVLVGDFNAFDVNDGYADVMGTIVGTPAPADEVVVPNTDAVDPDLVMLGEATPAQRYSYTFDGNAQILDHVLVTRNLDELSPVLHYARNDADFPDVLRGDATRPERLSDHDMPVAYFTLARPLTLVWRNQSTGANGIWSMTGTTIDSVAALPTVSDVSWRLVGIADFDGDGKLDILWRNQATGANGLWFMDGLTRTRLGALPAVADTAWHVVGTADMDGDGDADIVWRHQGTGANGVWTMNGATLSGTVALLAVPDTGWQIAGLGDFNADHKPDLVWRHRTTGANAVWLMDGTTKVSGVALPAVTDPSWVIGSIADFNADGQPDIVWRNQTTGADGVWFMNGTVKDGVGALPAVPDTAWRIVPSDF